MTAASTDKKGGWIIRAIIAVMAILLAFLIARIIITFTNPESIWDSPKLAVNAPQSNASRGTQDFSFNTDPFNRMTPTAIEDILDEGEDAPETTLKLTLTGRTTGLDGSGSAILITPDNKQARYRLEDEILPGVTLQAVNKDFIVLNVDGQVQRLTFDRSLRVIPSKQTGRALISRLTDFLRGMSLQLLAAQILREVVLTFSLYLIKRHKTAAQR